MILYDRLRPIIIHVAHIETLAELCSILKTEILMDNVKTNGLYLFIYFALTVTEKLFFLEKVLYLNVNFNNEFNINLQ